MILTTTLINTTILKAYCSLALKSIKYYTALALGKNNTCLFKEMTLLRVYVDILKNFEIVGSTPNCNCCIEGEYTVVLSDDSIGKLKFNCDNTGYLYSGGVGYDFIYYYDNYNKEIFIDFGLNSDLLTSVTFTSNCSFTALIGGATSPFFLPKDEPATYANVDTTACTAVVIQTCLSNNQVIKIIQHVNKIIK
jgi:hypothetical protein